MSAQWLERAGQRADERAEGGREREAPPYSPVRETPWSGTRPPLSCEVITHPNPAARVAA